MMNFETVNDAYKAFLYDQTLECLENTGYINVASVFLAQGLAETTEGVLDSWENGLIFEAASHDTFIDTILEEFIYKLRHGA